MASASSWLPPERLVLGRLGDRGASLAEAIIATGLAAIAMAGLATLLGASARSTERISNDDPLAGVAIDWLASDLRAADGLDVVGTTADDVVSLDIVIDGASVRWESSDGSVTRLAPGEADALSVVDGLRVADALVITLRDAAGAVVAPTDSDVVDGCTVMVDVRLIDTEDDVVHARTVGLRHRPGVTPTC